MKMPSARKRNREIFKQKLSTTHLVIIAIVLIILLFIVAQIGNNFKGDIKEANDTTTQAGEDSDDKNEEPAKSNTDTANDQEKAGQPSTTQSAAEIIIEINSIDDSSFPYSDACLVDMANIRSDIEAAKESAQTLENTYKETVVELEKLKQKKDTAVQEIDNKREELENKKLSCQEETPENSEDTKDSSVENSEDDEQPWNDGDETAESTS